MKRTIELNGTTLLNVRKGRISNGVDLAIRCIETNINGAAEYYYRRYNPSYKKNYEIVEKRLTDLAKKCAAQLVVIFWMIDGEVEYASEFDIYDALIAPYSK